MERRALPAWAQEMRELFRAGTTSQFVLHGNVFDLVPSPDGKGFLPLRQYLTEVMFEPFEVVVQYDRGKGIRVRKGSETFHRFLKAFDAFEGTAWASMPRAAGQQERAAAALELPGLLPREPKPALELIDRFLRGSLARTKIVEGAAVADPLRVAVLIDYAHFIAPQGDPIYLADSSQTLIQLLDWASDPAVTGAFAATVLITENLADLQRLLVENPYSAKIRIDLPNASEMREFIAALTPDDAEFAGLSEIGRDALGERLVGLSRVAVRTLVQRVRASGAGRLTDASLTRMKKETIEKEAFGRLEFIESSRTLDDVAGHDEAKAWLRQDAVLLRKGAKAAIPMGYLLTGRIGTGKTYMVECLAGEIGIPCVELKNFREKWVGATEGNLEKVFSILHALGQVIVFVDEADQAMGRRGGGEGDSGLSGRVYAMMAREMSDTNNRGKIIWIFATSRPDLLEVDLKRQGRLDVHIPLFPPGSSEGRRALFAAMAKKLRLPVAAEQLPPLPENDQLGGNEMEGILVRALRLFETQGEGTGDPGGADGAGDTGGPGGSGGRPLPEIIAEVIQDVRPSAHSERLELMDLLAVKECTDARFLPERFRSLSLTEVNQRIGLLKAAVGED